LKSSIYDRFVPKSRKKTISQKVFGSKIPFPSGLEDLMGPALGKFIRQLGTQQGRFSLKFSLFKRTKPLILRAAWLYRRTLIRSTRLAAIVGSFGKTTTTRMVLTALCGDTRKLFEFNAPAFVAMALLRTIPGTRYGAVEVAIREPGQMSPIAELVCPDIVVVTSIGSEHNRSFLNLETTRQEKSKMAAALKPDGLAVLNGDDDNVLWMKDHIQSRMLTYGFRPENDIRAVDYSMQWPDGTRFRLLAGGESHSIRMRLLGRHMVYPLLAAAAAAYGEGIPINSVLPDLAEVLPTPGRMQPVKLSNGITLLRDDYKSSLETIETALATLAEIDARRKIVVLGEISEPPGSQGLIYGRIGERLAETADAVVLVTERKAFERYRSGLNRGGFPRSAIINSNRSPRKAAEAVQRLAESGDVVLIKGKDIQRLERVAFALMGERVLCDLAYCRRKASRCAHCDLLAANAAGE
jgi:UDP-N-acetylmuramoyl-tripeptide--D-alanyl-D-alanine ligase